MSKFIPKEIAQELSLLGFNKPCMGYWNKYLPHIIFSYDKLDCFVETNISDIDFQNDFLAPIYSDVIDWFDEKYGVIIYIMPLRDQTVEPERFIFLPAISLRWVDPDIYQDPWDADTVILDRYISMETAILEAIRLVKVGGDKNTID